jgi:hypothetical protein
MLMVRRIVLLVAGLLVVVGLALPGVALAEEGCPNESLRQGFSAVLPDCRAYEQVTPVYKQGVGAHMDAVSSDGSRAIVASIGNFGDAQNNVALSSFYELSRGASGWVERTVEPSGAQFPWSFYVDAAPDLSRTLWEARASSESIFDFDYWVRDAGGAMHDLGPVFPPSQTAGPPGLGEPTGGATAHYAGGSSDLSRVLFELMGQGLPGNRWPGDTTPSVESTPSLYEYVLGHAGPPALVGVDDSGRLISECGVTAGGYTSSGSLGLPPPSGGVSADGSVVFFGVAGSDRYNCGLREPLVEEVYARLNGSSTVAISEPAPNLECTSVACLGAPLGDAEFVAASRDGSRAFFTSTQQLTDGASEDSTPGDTAMTIGGGCSNTSGVGGCNLYEYDFNSPVGRNLVLVSGGDPDPRVQGVVRVSEDGSHVYFVARGVLTHAANEFGAVAVSGADNLYVFERDAAFPAGRVAFVAGLSPQDAPDWGVKPGGLDREGGEAAVTPDGGFLVFPSVADLTPDDTSTVAQIFRYDAGSGELVRVSVGAGGFNNDGNTSTLPASIPIYNGTVSRVAARVATTASAVSGDGSVVVFESADGLTPGALNAQPLENGARGFAENVYEYRGGVVSLISDGRDTSAGQFNSSLVEVEGTVGSGRDVFFLTADPLVAQDGDTQVDIYDARAGGGFPGEPVAGGCAGEACRGALSSAPGLAGAGSASYAGAGNLAPVTSPLVKQPVKAKPKKRKVKPRKHKRKGRGGAKGARARLAGGGRSR